MKGANAMKKTVCYGLLSGAAAWIPLVIADWIDEKICDEGSGYGLVVFFAMPVLILLCYIVHVLRKKPAAKQLLAFLGCYIVTFSLLWLAFGATDGNLLIEQKHRGDWIDLNGIEYIFYGFTALLALLLLIGLFHLTGWGVKKLQQSKPE